IRHNIINLFRKACRIADPEERKKALTIYIVGAGFTGVEMAGELAEYLPIICEKFEIDRNDVKITIIDILERTITLLPEELSRKVEKRLKKMGVNMMFGTYVVGVGEDYIETKKDDVVTRHDAAMVIWGAGIESADITGEAAKVLESARRGRIKVDRYLRSLKYHDVFVIGDNMLFYPDGEEQPVPQIVENAELSAETASRNIASLITGEGELEEYKPTFHGFMVSIGGRYGVARVGFPNRMLNLPSFFAMFAKHMINMLYFVKILGWNKVWSYLRHEFFTIRHCRSFVGGHFSNRTPSFLLVPLRVWLGAVWVYEGIMKYVKGWAAEPILADSIKDTNGWYDSILNNATNGVDGVSGATDAVANATDAVTGATGEVAEVVESVGTTIINWDFFGLFKAILVSGNDLANSTIGDFAFKLDIPLLNWFMDTFILSSDSTQILMQTLMFLAEIIIGLLLIAGLFTFPAAGASLALQLMFISSTGQYVNTFWMIFAAIAVLIGGGRIFGLDYYVMPALKNWWKGLPLVRRLYIYND
ncbi:MAG: FAD-dependent oxidoreductase, partial [Clostridiales bacterium]|nr:FAD-dependent oxidoreductase [Clostridiales bacterium]